MSGAHLGGQWDLGAGLKIISEIEEGGLKKKDRGTGYMGRGFMPQ